MSALCGFYFAVVALEVSSRWVSRPTWWRHRASAGGRNMADSSWKPCQDMQVLGPLIYGGRTDGNATHHGPRWRSTPYAGSLIQPLLHWNDCPWMYLYECASLAVLGPKAASRRLLLASQSRSAWCLVKGQPHPYVERATSARWWAFSQLLRGCPVAASACDACWGVLGICRLTVRLTWRKKSVVE